MKMLCPVCGIEGFLQQRGNSRRIQHYAGYREGKQSFTYHKLELNGSESVEVKTIRLGLDNKLMVGSMGFEPMTSSLEGWRSIRAELTTQG